MSITPTHPDVIADFNDQLAQAKLGALRILQDLMSTLSSPDAVISAAARELRLLATTILRTSPLKLALPQAPPKAPRTSPTERPSSPQQPSPRPSPAPAREVIALASRILNTPPRELKGNPDVRRLLARRTAMAAGAPAP